MNSNQTKTPGPLTGFIVGFRPPKLVGHRIFPMLFVDGMAGHYSQFDKDYWTIQDSLRAEKTESNTVDIGFKKVPFALEERALHAELSWNAIELQDAGLNAEMRASRKAYTSVLNEREALIFGADGILRNPANNVYNGSVNLTNLATADFRTEFKRAKLSVELACGMLPNVIAMGANVLETITNTAQYVDGTKHMENIMTFDGQPKSIFDMEVLKVPGLVNAAGRKGQSKGISTRLMGNDIWMGYVDPELLDNDSESDPLDVVRSGGKGSAVNQDGDVLTYGRELFWKEYTDTWEDKKTRKNSYEYGRIYRPHLVAMECGALINATLPA